MALLARSSDGAIVAAACGPQLVVTSTAGAGASHTVDEAHGSAIRGLAVAPDGSCVASVSDDKMVKLWSSTTGELVASSVIPKKPTACAFATLHTPDAELAVIVGDRVGDVYALAAAGDMASKSRLLFGHTASVITDVSVTADDSRVLTGDRDEKVRVTRLPFGHRTDNFFLGHFRFVSRVACLRHAGGGANSVTGGGDAQVMLWRNAEGRPLDVVALGAVPEREVEGTSKAPGGSEEAAGAGNGVTAGAGAGAGAGAAAGGAAAGGNADSSEFVKDSSDSDIVSVLAECPVTGRVAAAVLDRPDVTIFSRPDSELKAEQVLTVAGSPVEGVFDGTGALIVVVSGDDIDVGASGAASDDGDDAVGAGGDADAGATGAEAIGNLSLVYFAPGASGSLARAKAPVWLEASGIAGVLAGIGSGGATRVGVADALMQKHQVAFKRLRQDQEPSIAKR